MRLIHCESLRLEEFFGSSIPKYAILSHTWASEEVSFTAFATNLTAARSKLGFRKIDFTCQQAIAEGLEYAWVDTACINKSSSAELSEAINSMYNWYKEASVCYAYLSDVTNNGFAEEFSKTRWFQRSWTLQELIAPDKVIFFDSAWNELGSKKDHARLIHDITQIDEEVLTADTLTADTGPNSLHVYCIAKRMAWASQRETTRIEDMAYCLLGIFNVNMPLLYGEGNSLSSTPTRDYQGFRRRLDPSMGQTGQCAKSRHDEMLGRVYGRHANNKLIICRIARRFCELPRYEICSKLYFGIRDEQPGPRHGASCNRILSFKDQQLCPKVCGRTSFLQNIRNVYTSGDSSCGLRRVYDPQASCYH